MPHPFRAPFQQPYPCAEDEECSTDEYCASPTRGTGAGAQICLTCRKRRKRCMRHAMCCPGNYCKNGEFLRSLPDSNCPAFAHLQMGENVFCSANEVAPPANGYSVCKFPLKYHCSCLFQRREKYRSWSSLSSSVFLNHLTRWLISECTPP